MESLAPWLWLVEFRSARRALDASETNGDVAAALLGHFEHVDVVRARQESLDRVRVFAAEGGWAPATMGAGELRNALWDAGSFDCVALHDALDQRGISGEGAVEYLRVCRNLLAREGWLALASPNPAFRGIRRGNARGEVPTKMIDLLVRSGFREVRCFYTEPSIDRPLSVVPEGVDASPAFERSSAMRGATSWPRRIAARLGVRSALYPGYFLLAKA